MVFIGISEPREWKKGRVKLGFKVLDAVVINLKSDFGRPIEDTLHTPPHMPGNKTFPSAQF